MAIEKNAPSLDSAQKAAPHIVRKGRQSGEPRHCRKGLQDSLAVFSRIRYIRKAILTLDIGLRRDSSVILSPVQRDTPTMLHIGSVVGIRVQLWPWCMERGC